MRHALKYLLCTIAIVVSASAFASGLVIHAAEFGVGKFHRMDNKVHPYGAGNAWLPYILADGAQTDKTVVQDNADGSVSVFFNNLDDMMKAVVEISHQRNEKVAVLNVHGHGLPGGMWFPKDEATLNSRECDSWRAASDGDDKGNYDQYYAATSKDEVLQIRSMSTVPASTYMGCVTGLDEWKDAVAKNADFVSALSDNTQLHFLSCVVGLGKAGEDFTQGIAQLLLKPGADGRVETSLNFGLGDWSMVSGMGFWDYVTDDQINHDSSVYPVDRRDSELAQKGTIRMVAAMRSGSNSQLLAGRDVMNLGFEAKISGTPVEDYSEILTPEVLPDVVRIPGTNAFVTRVR